MRPRARIAFDQSGVAVRPVPSRDSACHGGRKAHIPGSLGHTQIPSDEDECVRQPHRCRRQMNGVLATQSVNMGERTGTLNQGGADLDVINVCGDLDELGHRLSRLTEPPQPLSLR